MTLRRRYAAISVMAGLMVTGLTGCSGLPGWLDERISDGPSVSEAPIAYPDLAGLPPPPGPPPTEGERAGAVQELTAARAANAAAADSLNEEIENDFEFPAASSN